jgi:hypothetical protein
MSSPEDRIIGLDNDNGMMSPDVMAELAGTTPEQPKIQPKVAKATVVQGAKVSETKTPPTNVNADADAKDETDLDILNKRIRDMEAAIQLLVTGRDNIKLRAATIERKPIDWQKMNERDVFDLSSPIDVVDHQMPDYMNVECTDSNFVLRWVNKIPRRLGPMKAMGFRFCEKEDIKGELNIAIEANANGQFQFDDVILMKIEKRIYYGMLRKNHQRALNLVDPKKAHQTAKDRVVADMRTTSDGSGEFDKRVAANQLSVYSPHFDL